MTNASRRASRWGRLLFIGAGLLTLAALVSDSNTRAAQKTDKGKTTAPQVFNDIIAKPKDSKGNEVEVGIDVIAFINEQLEKGWKDNKLTPADRCTDYEFIRRASLDLIGRIAKVSEIAEFMNDPPQYRRSALIERLLANPEFANHFANIWTNMLLTRSIGDPYHSQMHLWLFEQFSNDKGNIGWDKVVTQLLSDSGRTSDTNPDKERPAVTYILAHLGEQIPPGNGNANWKENGRFDMVPVTSRTTRLFLGLRTQCTQCHDHPFNDEWRQSHFWGVNAFFRQVDAPNGRITPMGAAKKKKKGEMGKQQFSLVDNPGFNVEALVPYERRNGLVQYSKPVFLFGEKLPVPKKPGEVVNRRQELAKFLTKNDYFGKAFANRMWGHFFGRSFTKDPDDFGEHNPISHPVLLDKIAKEWTGRFKHDPKMLVRWICNSRAYGLSSVANETNDKSDAEPFFSRTLLKAMSPEQLFESLMVATEAKAGQNKDARADMREKWLNKLVLNFGDDEGSEGTFNGTVVQALLMMNGQEINSAIMEKDSGTLSKIFAKYGKNLVGNSPGNLDARRGAMKALYLAALNRPPNDREMNHVLSDTVMRFPKMPGRARDLAFYHGYFQDMFWALLNSNEFILNH
jgi:hypothetical protein